MDDWECPECGEWLEDDLSGVDPDRFREGWLLDCPYCSALITPRLDNGRLVFADAIAEEDQVE